MEHHRNADELPPLDSEIASLARVKLTTWRVVVGAFAWLFALSGGLTANTVAIRNKADAETVTAQRQGDRDLLAAKLDAIDRRLAAIETQLREEAAARTQAAAIASAIEAGQGRKP